MDMLKMTRTYLLLLPVSLAVVLMGGCNGDDTVFEERCIDKAKGTWTADAVFIKQSQDSGASLQEDSFNDWSDFELTLYTDGTYVWDDGSGILVPTTGSFTFEDDCSQAIFEGSQATYTVDINFLSSDRFEFTLEIEGFKGGGPRDFYFRLVPKQ
jgi:hypothetical protein